MRERESKNNVCMYHQIKSDLESGQSKAGEKPVTAGARIFRIFVDSKLFVLQLGRKGASCIIILGTYLLDLSLPALFGAGWRGSKE
jgi:hypothetical protein